MIVEVAEGAPHHMDARGHGKGALGVAQHKVVDDHVAIDRSLDTADFDRHTGFQLQRRDLADQEFFAGLRVEGQQQPGDQDDEAKDQPGNPKDDLLPERPSFPDDQGLTFGSGRGRVFGHQNACPMPI